MINREMQNVSVISFQAGTDEYGQKRTQESSRRTIKMFYKIYAQSEVQTPIYNNVELIGLTTDANITDENQIEISNKRYNILHIIPSRRYNQILMKKV